MSAALSMIEVDQPVFRLCGGCRQTYERTSENFHRDRAAPDGLQLWCKGCRIAAAAKRQERDRQTIEYAKAAMAGRMPK